jgi:hypothetical protein
LTRNRIRHCAAADDHLPRCVFVRSRGVAGLKERFVFEDLFAAGTGRQMMEDIFHSNAQVSQTRASTALLRVDGYTV